MVFCGIWDCPLFWNRVIPCHWSIPSIECLHKPVAQIPQYPTVHHFATEMCTCVHISVTKWCIVGHLTNASWTFLMGLLETFDIVSLPHVLLYLLSVGWNTFYTSTCCVSKNYAPFLRFCRDRAQCQLTNIFWNYLIAPEYDWASVFYTEQTHGRLIHGIGDMYTDDGPGHWRIVVTADNAEFNIFLTP